MFLTGLKDNFLSNSKEFSFSLNDKSLDGGSGWKLLSTEPIHDDMKGKGVKLILQADNSFKIRIELNYLLYPQLPVIRKWIRFQNTGNEEYKIENLNIEDLETRIGYVHSMIYNNYGRMKHIGPFEGDWDDPVVVLHDIDQPPGHCSGQ